MPKNPLTRTLQQSTPRIKKAATKDDDVNDVDNLSGTRDDFMIMMMMMMMSDFCIWMKTRDKKSNCSFASLKVLHIRYALSRVELNRIELKYIQWNMNVNIIKAVCKCNNAVIYAVKLKSYLYNQRYMATKMRMCFVCDGKSSQTNTANYRTHII